MKNIHHGINRFMDQIIIILKECFRVINEDRLLLITLVYYFLMDLMVKIAAEMSLFNVRSFFFNLAWYALFIALSFHYKSFKKRKIYFITLFTFHFILTLGNNIYYRYYRSFLSVSIIKQLQLFTAMPDSGDIGFELITLIDVLTVLIYIGTLIVIRRYTKINQFVYEGKSNQIKGFIRGNFLRLSGVSFLMGILFMQGAQYSQVAKLWNRPIVVENFGLTTYHLVDSVKSASLFVNFDISEEDYQRFVDYFEKREKVENAYSNIFEGKNVIVIHAESIENFVINRSINGVEITPNINRLANTGFYYRNTYPQQSVGTSSDSEFIFATSLLPVNNGTIFLTHFDRTYLTTQKLLLEKGYHTVSMHGNNGWFWNRNVMHPQLGFEEFLSYEYYEGYPEEEKIGLGISDKMFFEMSMKYLLELNQSDTPFYAHLITLTNHTPWTETDKYIVRNAEGEEYIFPCGEELEKKQICRYLQAVHYADYAIGYFIDMLGQYEMLDDTIIVLYGDHPANLKMKEMELFYQVVDNEAVNLDYISYQAQQQVPFIIWSEDIEEPQVFEQTIGMLDMAPILQNMLGIHNPFNLGRDYPYDKEHQPFDPENLNPYDHHIVPFINGDWTDGIVFYNHFKRGYIVLHPDVDHSLITPEYIQIQSKRAEEIVEISNIINNYDAIYEYYKRENQAFEFEEDLLQDPTLFHDRKRFKEN